MRLVSLIISLIALTGCSTSYTSHGLFGGYRDMQFAPDIFRITFHGNAYTSSERAQDFAFLRACELTLDNGCTCFALLDNRNSTSVSSFSTPASSTTTTTGSGTTTGTVYNHQFQGYTYLNATSQTTYTPGQTFYLFKPHSGLMIQTFTNKPAEIPTFDAAFMEKQITNRYHIHLKHENKP